VFWVLASEDRLQGAGSVRVDEADNPYFTISSAITAKEAAASRAKMRDSQVPLSGD